MVERRLWDFQTPLRQFKELSADVLKKLDNSKFTIEQILEMKSDEIGQLFLSYSIIQINVCN